MASLKDLRSRITSVKSTQKITKAMQMVAAAKLRRAQEIANASQPYAERMSKVISNLAQSVKDLPDAPELLIGKEQKEQTTHLLIILTSDRGLCGGFNTNIIRLAKRQINELEQAGKTVKLFIIGNKGYDMLKQKYKKQIIDHIIIRAYPKIGSDLAQDISSKILSLYEDQRFDFCHLLSARFQSVMSQKPEEKILIPAIASTTQEIEEKKDKSNGAIYEYEPDETSILEDLLPRNIMTQILVALLENTAGEMGARMTAMDNATRNAGELVDKLTLEYNCSRQAMITKELIEIISGAESL